jgi:hypothetical protein
MSLFRERSTQRVLSVCVTFCAMAAAIVATQGVLAAPQRWWRDQAIQQKPSSHCRTSPTVRLAL